MYKFVIINVCINFQQSQSIEVTFILLAWVYVLLLCGCLSSVSGHCGAFCLSVGLFCGISSSYLLGLMKTHETFRQTLKLQMTQLQTRANTLLSAHGKQILTKLKKNEKVSLKDKNRLSSSIITTGFALPVILRVDSVERTKHFNKIGMI